MQIRKNDTVRIIQGASRGKEGKIIRAFPEENKVMVQGANLVWKHMRRSQQHPHGARIQKEAPISVTNVILVCPNCNKSTRGGYTIMPSGIKSRVCKKCRQPIAEV